MKHLATITIAAACLLASPAFAAQTVCGQVSSADPSSGLLKLTSGEAFRVKVPVILRGMEPGRHVRVTINDDRTVGVTNDPRFESQSGIVPNGSCLQ